MNARIQGFPLEHCTVADDQWFSLQLPVVGMLLLISANYHRISRGQQTFGNMQSAVLFPELFVMSAYILHIALPNVEKDVIYYCRTKTVHFTAALGVCS